MGSSTAMKRSFRKGVRRSRVRARLTEARVRLRYRRNSCSIVISAETALPSFMAGRHFQLRKALVALSSRPNPRPRITWMSVISPAEVTTMDSITVPCTFIAFGSCGYSGANVRIALGGVIPLLPLRYTGSATPSTITVRVVCFFASRPPAEASSCACNGSAAPTPKAAMRRTLTTSGPMSFDLELLAHRRHLADFNRGYGSPHYCRNLADLRHQHVELIGEERLRTVGQSLIRLRMHFDH